METKATYSPDDNKLRLYPDERLDTETYKKARELGFIWAPKQKLFVAPCWTPAAEDFCIELAGEIQDEDSSLVDRAEERAERFEQYSENREKDAEQARQAVHAIADNIPFGQPILIGHHSEKRARRDQEKIEQGMHKAVKMWEQSQYWQQRAANAISHAKYLERPDVRARRIKKIEADKRKRERENATHELFIKLWNAEPVTWERAKKIFNDGRFYFSYCFTLEKYPRQAPKSTYEGYMSMWSALDDSPELSIVTPEQAGEICLNSCNRSIAHNNRWIEHFNNRLLYENVMLNENGGLASDKTKPEKGGACKCWASHRNCYSYIQKVNKITVTVLDNWGNGGRNFTRNIPFDKIFEIMTAEEVEQNRKNGDLIETSDKTGFSIRGEAIPDAKHFKENPENPYKDIKVEVVVIPQLFPTPQKIVDKMIELAEIKDNDTILEPSAGTGNILRSIPNINERITLGTIQACELDYKLAEHLKKEFEGLKVYQGDFLQLNGEIPAGFSLVIMNPPFKNGEDIKHINHAFSKLITGGRLVALCANGPRQQKEFQDAAEYWEELGPGNFSVQGTSVNVALMVLKKD